MGTTEQFHEYYARFKKLLAKCPQHRISDADIIQHFCAGLTLTEMSLLNAACGGTVMNKTPTEAWQMIAQTTDESYNEMTEGSGEKEKGKPLRSQDQ